MLLAVCIGLGGVALAVSLRWALVRVDALGRPHPFPFLAFGLPTVGAVLCAVPVVQHARLESQLGAAAGALVGASVGVRCETVGQAWLDAHPERGYVQIGKDGAPEHLAVITHDTCNDLSAWIGSDKRSPDEAQVVSVHVLAHEAMHMKGITDEAAAECAAVQRDARLAQLLGATREQGLALARRYFSAVYPRMPDAYRTGGCAAGGSLDEHLEDSPWT